MLRSHRMFALLAAPALFLVLAGPAVAVDLVFKKSEGRAGGDITKIDRNGITVKDAVKGDIVIPAADVAYVQWEGEPQPLKNGRTAESAGRLDDALAHYESATATATDDVKRDAEFLVARTAAKLALADAAQLDTAISKLDAFRKANDQFYRYYEALALLGELQTRKGNFEQADAVFSELEATTSPEIKLAARNAKARVLLAKGETDAALTAFEAIASAPATTPVEQARQYEALLGKADALRRKGSFPEAITTLQEVVDKVAAGETGIQAEAYLRQGDCYREMTPPQPKDALFAYLHVDVLFANEPALHAEALYRLVDLWTIVGRENRSTEKRQELLARYGKSEWARKLGQ